MKIAILLPGHIRSYNNIYKNIQTQLINVLIEAGYDCYTFTSIWANSGFREINWAGNIDTDILEKNSTVFEIEDDKRENFIKSYNNDKWKDYRHLSGADTCGDAASMWYKVEKCCNLMKSYEEKMNINFDYIFRLRPDLYFPEKFNIQLLEDIKSDEIAMAYWHQRYKEVTCCMMDQFAFGKNNSMKKYCSVYSNLNNIMKRNDCPFTGEGFLSSHLKQSQLSIKRIPIQYCLARSSHLEKMTI